MTLRHEPGHAHVRAPAGGVGLAFAAPPVLRTGPVDEPYLGRLAEALGIARDRIVDHQWVDNGPGWAVLRLPTADDVLALRPDLSGVPAAMVGVIGPYPAGGDHEFEIRAFAPGVGVAEDPVTGSLNASVAQWLLATGAVDGGYRASQGRCVGRAGTVVLDLDDTGAVWVGGATTTCIAGTIVL